MDSLYKQQMNEKIDGIKSMGGGEGGRGVEQNKMEDYKLNFTYSTYFSSFRALASGSSRFSSARRSYRNYQPLHIKLSDL